jgi:hypothetical protein
VIEHLDDDRRAMDNIATFLVPDGKAIILVPSGMWMYGSPDEVLKNKRRYSWKTLQEIGSQAGLTALMLMLFNRISKLAWYVNGRLFRKKAFSRFQMTIRNLLIPAVKKFDRLLPWPSLDLIGAFEKK